MANIISDETIEYVGILAKLELNEEEKEQAKKDMVCNDDLFCLGTSKISGRFQPAGLQVQYS